jgi:hypothetical protein
MYRPPSADATVKQIRQAQDSVVRSSAAPRTSSEVGVRDSLLGDVDCEDLY